MLDCARRGKRRPGSAHCTWREGLAESLDLPESSFGTVVTSLLPHHLPEELRAAALRVMYRVLRPGGRLPVAEFRPPKGRRLGRHVVHGGAGHARAHRRVDLLDGLVADTGFEVCGRGGGVRPRLRCAALRACGRRVHGGDTGPTRPRQSGVL